MREIFEKTVLENIVGIPLRDCLGFYCINDGEYDHFNCLFTVLHSELRNAQKQRSISSDSDRFFWRDECFDFAWN